MNTTFRSRRTLGIIGGGQLARMLAIAARPLDIDCVTLEPTGMQCSAGPVSDVIVGEFDDKEALAVLADRCDVITVELEAVPPSTMEWLADRVPVRPGVEAVRTSQDRLLEKQLLRSLGIATAPFNEEVLANEPAIVKTRRGGYDGRGQIRVANEAERTRAIAELPDPIVEGLVRFGRELSLVAARSIDGAIAFYPLVENVHHDGILRETTAPATVSAAQQAAGERLATLLLEKLDYIGVIGIELFDVDGALLVNEFAPRVHNTGHWTIEGAHTSQFEQHVRAVMGLPLGSTSARGAALMINAIGALPDEARVLGIPATHMHAYGKEDRPGRKVGHVTITAESLAELEFRAAAVRAAF